MLSFTAINTSLSTAACLFSMILLFTRKGENRCIPRLIPFSLSASVIHDC